MRTRPLRPPARPVRAYFRRRLDHRPGCPVCGLHHPPAPELTEEQRAEQDRQRRRNGLS